MVGAQVRARGHWDEHSVVDVGSQVRLQHFRDHPELADTVPSITGLVQAQFWGSVNPSLGPLPCHCGSKCLSLFSDQGRGFTLKLAG